MASVDDVVAYVLRKSGGSLPHMKLQKLLYYSQAWSLVWDEKPLFQARIEAWANGPVVPAVYRDYRKEYVVDVTYGDWAKLSKGERETVDRVVEFYGERDSQWLSDLTHREDPWKNARKRARLGVGERGNEVITHAEMAEYYSGL